MYDYLFNYNGTGSLFVVQKNCENLDVDLEAIACVHSLHYSTVHDEKNETTDRLETNMIGTTDV